MKKLASWNVNGLRACEKKGLWQWLAHEQPTIFNIQETKAHPTQLSTELINNDNYYTYYASAEKKGYSGVALFSAKNYPRPKVTIGLGIEEFDREGRTIIAEYPEFILFNGYFPNGQRDHGRVPYKLSYSREIIQQALALKKKKKKPIIICGDLNTAHHEIDLANPKTNNKTTGFLPSEREWLSECLEQGFHDVFREHHPAENGHYTWWTYRGDCRQRNIGWRIDYFLTTNDLLKSVKKTYHLPQVMGSDHCPIMLELK